MRREGYEFCVSPPRVLTTEDEEGNKFEPIEEVGTKNYVLLLFSVLGTTATLCCLPLLVSAPEVVVVVVVVVVVFTLKSHPGFVSIQYLLLSLHQSLYSSCH